MRFDIIIHIVQKENHLLKFVYKSESKQWCIQFTELNIHLTELTIWIWSMARIQTLKHVYWNDWPMELVYVSFQMRHFFSSVFFSRLQHHTIIEGVWTSLPGEQCFVWALCEKYRVFAPYQSMSIWIQWHPLSSNVNKKFILWWSIHNF